MTSIDSTASGPVQVFHSWGRVGAVSQHVLSYPHRHLPLPVPCTEAMTMLPRGNGRSYGDSNLNPKGALLPCASLDHFIAFDPTTGVLRCESGVLLQSILELVVPQGWFLPVTPGTQFVTIGGAVANDVHGKNHHVNGCFGSHVRCLELLRSDGSRRVCSPQLQEDWFAATIGGLGLTGLMTWVEIQLQRIHNPYMDVETIRFATLEEFFELSAASERDHAYTVAWIDCAGDGRRLGRGLFSRANHAPAQLGAAAGALTAQGAANRRKRHVPVTPPCSLVNGLTVKAFNALYYHRQRQECRRELAHYQPFFYPLDALLQWNRIYGPRGFYQYQSVVPPENALEVTRRMLALIASSGMGSFLAVLKQFGHKTSKGMLSFPMAGTTLALDFPNLGPRLMRLFDELDHIVGQAGGRLYPAKDGRLPPASFAQGYPRWQEFSAYVDPRFSSGLWRRVTRAP